MSQIPTGHLCATGPHPGNLLYIAPLPPCTTLNMLVSSPLPTLGSSFKVGNAPPRQHQTYYEYQTSTQCNVKLHKEQILEVTGKIGDPALRPNLTSELHSNISTLAQAKRVRELLAQPTIPNAENLFT
ncbi:Hypothetical predicted protein [Pelobates cultripes]|uniref:Uncharacterized protein n=1 Tax=Pelobates cultripes TaxID=61616 RepID=A0AAD1WJF5_PELCU|nr:Hypothetical predicted protein [Pelobates cultripes]